MLVKSECAATLDGRGNRDGGKEVDIARARQMDAFDAEITQRDGRVAAELALKAEVPLLGARIAEIV